jgi:hypothetical protein
MDHVVIDNIPGTYQIIHTIVSANEERLVHSWLNHFKSAMVLNLPHLLIL